MLVDSSARIRSCLLAFVMFGAIFAFYLFTCPIIYRLRLEKKRPPSASWYSLWHVMVDHTVLNKPLLWWSQKCGVGQSFMCWHHLRLAGRGVLRADEAQARRLERHVPVLPRNGRQAECE